jgi:hypothetical protein
LRGLRRARSMCRCRSRRGCRRLQMQVVNDKSPARFNAPNGFHLALWDPFQVSC